MLAMRTTKRVTGGAISVGADATPAMTGGMDKSVSVLSFTQGAAVMPFHIV